MADADIPPPDASGNAVSPQAYVYVIASGEEVVKIGVAKNTQGRLRGLQTAHSRKLSVMYEVACCDRSEAYAIEGRAHDALRASALEGEWFAVSPGEAMAAVQQAMRDIREEQRRKEVSAKSKAESEVKALPTYVGPEVIQAEPWMRDPMDVIRFVCGKEDEAKEEYLINFGDCILFVACRRERETGERFFFMNDVSRWYMREGDGSQEATNSNLLGSPPCALFATIFEPPEVAA
jgi:hypothetical protein